MMKKLLIFLIAVTSTFALNAQITLTSGDVPFQVPHTEYRQSLQVSGLTLPQAGTNMTWNYTSATKDTEDTLYFYKPTDPQFSSADRYYIGTIPFGSFSLENEYYFVKNSNGIQNVGNYTRPARIGLGSFTMNNNDSLIFTGTHNVNFSSPITYLQTPTSYDSVWETQSSFVTDFELTVQLAGYNQAPGYNIQHVTSLDSVIGWGDMVLPVIGGSNDTFEVLMIKTKQTYVDSYYINGSPAPSQLLSSFGLKQNDSTYSYYYRFYTPDYDGNLMEIYFSDEFQTATYASYAITTGTMTSNDMGIKSEANVQLYPNPLEDNALRLSGQAGDYLMTIYDMAGKAQFTKNLQIPANGEAAISLGELGQGIYFYQLTNKLNGASYTGKLLKQ